MDTTTVDVIHFTDPGCPWAWSEAPALAVLRHRFGAQLRWRMVLIGLTESADRYVERGYTPAQMARAYVRFRRRGMPLSTEPRPRLLGTGRACRAVVAAGLLHPGGEVAALRALQEAWFCTTLLLDEDDDLLAALRDVEGIDAGAVVAAIDDPATQSAYAAGHAEARTAAGGAAEAQERTAQSDGRVRYTAPSLVFEQGDRRLEAGGFQPIEAYDLALANLAPQLDRAPPATDPLALLRAAPHALTTREIAACIAERNDAPDDRATEDLLSGLLAAGEVTCAPLANGMSWRPV